MSPSLKTKRVKKAAEFGFTTDNFIYVKHGLLKSQKDRNE